MDFTDLRRFKLPQMVQFYKTIISGDFSTTYDDSEDGL